ncbi:MAG: hypothetical protein QM762_06305 [Chryseolinea sp.]
MSTISDDELQKMIEDGKTTSSTDRDFVAYQRVFGILNEKHTFRPTGIEDSIISRIEHAKKRTAFREHIWLVLGVVFLILGGIIAIAISGFSVALSGWQRNIIMLGVCAGLVIIVLNTLDRKLLNRQAADRH